MKKTKKGIALIMAAMFGFFGVSSDIVYAQADLTPAPVVAPKVEDAAGMPKPGHITINFKEVDIVTVLNYLSEVSGIDIIPSPGVKGTVTMRLRDKPWEVALDIVTRNYGFAYSREGDIIRVMPKSMLKTEDSVTEVIPLNHIVQDISLIKSTTSSSSASDEEVKVEKKEQTISQVMAAVNNILDKTRNERATFIASVNAIVITAIPAKINEVRAMIERIDKKPPQLLLDAKVVEIILDDTEQLGVDWDAVISASGARRPITFPFTNSGGLVFLPDTAKFDKYLPYGSTSGGVPDFPYVDLSTMVDPTAAATAGSVFSYGTLDFTQFQAVLRMVSSRGDTNLLSCPRVTTLNNQKATIKVVQKVMLQKTQESIQTANVVTVEFEKEADAREVGVRLTVIPHVNDQGDIMVNLIPEVSSDLTFTTLAVGAATSTVAMKYNTREANTQVRVKDGETIFIGGLIKDQVVKSTSKLPILGDMFGGIPWFGKLFQYDSTEGDKTEVVFFVTVHLAKDGKDTITKSYTTKHFDRYGQYGKSKYDSVNPEMAKKLEKKEIEDQEEQKEKAEANSKKQTEVMTVKNKSGKNLKTSSKFTDPLADPVVNDDATDSSEPWFDFRKNKQ
ncbi:MAG TPA: secretin and TonB N-terminal domain-containing protein [Candidatus Omnitrophota bacterium]|nr:secretin and TonB N-terminal domain-containing protein [Candidatus Omnitrophota bacterium]HPS20741.1 secretin and TonB N-terminal domain-containing protein [Candidatus Omnitrophota bacterium]